jgi:AcrR family transcriptional regulator
LQRRRRFQGGALMAPLDRKLRALEDRVSWGQEPSEVQRLRILSAMVEVACERGLESTSVARVLARSGVSRRTFYDLFEGRSDCLRAAIEDAVERASERAIAAYDPQARWVDRVRAGLRGLLELIDEEPELARLCLQLALGDPVALNGRGETLAQLTRVIDEGRAATRSSRNPASLAAQGVLGGVLGLIYARLIARDSRPLRELANPLMSMIVLPYLGPAAAQRELTRPVPPRAAPQRKPQPTPRSDPPADLNLRLTYRTLAVLEAIAAQPALSNGEVAERAGVTDQGEISKLLKRLAAHGLLENSGAGQAHGAANAWRLTGNGEQLLRAVSPVR